MMKMLHAPTRRTRRTVARITALSVALSLANVQASAGVFDALWQIFPKKSVESSAQLAAETDFDNSSSQSSDPVDHDAANHTLDATPNTPHDALLDSLIADDITPMLDTPDLYALLEAEFAADRGQIERALAIYKSESFKKNATAVFERALALSIEFETPDESLRFASAWQIKNPEHIPAWFYVTHLALKAGEYDQAAAMLSMILHYDPSSDLGQILTGIIPTNAEAQRELFIALQALNEQNASISVLRAGILMNLGEYKAALLHVNRALRLEPTNFAFATLKMDILHASDPPALWAYLKQVRKQFPHEKEGYLTEVRHLIDSGDLGGAWQLLTVANEQTNSADVSLLAALVGLDSGRTRQAIEILRPLLNNPNFASQANYYMGIGYERLGDALQARRHFEQVNSYELALDATSKVVDFYLANDEFDAAVRALVRLRDNFDAYAADSYILQAELYLRQGDKAHAKTLLTIANRDYPDDDRLLYASLKLLGDELDAADQRHTVDKLLELDSFNPNYQLLDARLRLLANPDDTEAVSIAQSISQLPLDDPNYDSQLQLEALIVLANHALVKQNYAAIIDYLQPVYDVAPTLEVGILLVRAHQGLGEMAAVDTLLADLQQRFGNHSAANNDAQDENLQDY